MKWVVQGVSGSHEVEVERTTGGFLVTIGDVTREVDFIPFDDAVASLRYCEDGRSFHVIAQQNGSRSVRMAVGEREFDWTVLTPIEAVEAEAGGAGGGVARIEAPIPGKVVAVRVDVGDEVAAGQPVVVLEAMKMENELAAEGPGRVSAVHVEPGQTVDSGTLLVEFEPLGE
jgi:biotin carboxyl carrier protein